MTKMDEHIKTKGYTAAISVTIIAAMLITIGFDAGWHELGGRILIIVGFVFALLAAGSFWRPDTFGRAAENILKENRK
jgi:hypothetical protein